MKIFPIAYDSFGVRSMATLIFLRKNSIFIDPGVALAPKRYGLPPTKEEIEAEKICRSKIMEICKKCKYVVVTHYHYDHHPYPEDREMYENCFKGKIVFCKHNKENINFSGKKRGAIFENRIKELAKNYEFADGKSFEFGKLKIEFSPAVWHGDVNSKVGTVIMVLVEYGKNKFLFGSDAQSFADPSAKNWVIEKNPNFLVVDGYPTLFVGWRLSQRNFENAKKNLIEVIKKINAKTIIFDHHGVRDLNYKEKMKDVFAVSKNLNKKILTAAEFYNLDNFFLEAWRKEIKKGVKKVDAKNYFKKLYSFKI